MSNYEIPKAVGGKKWDMSDVSFAGNDGENKKHVGSMTYPEIMGLIEKRYNNHEEVTLTEEEAEKYYGVKCCNLLRDIFDYCRNNNCTIYQHATDIESARGITKMGYLLQKEAIDTIPEEVLRNKPINVEYDEDGVKTIIYDGGQNELRWGAFRDELDDTQHFFANTNCVLDYGGLTNPNVNRSGFGATLLFVTSNEIKGSRENIQYGTIESHYDDFDDKEVDESHFKRSVVPKQFCIGYLDVLNRRFVANPDFQFKYGVTDNFSLGYQSAEERDLSIKLANNINNNKN